MARIRYVKPGFFTNDELAQCSFAARLLFVGLWTIADREGRLEDRPVRIKAEVMPLDAVDVSALIDELDTIGVVSRYQVGQRKYLQITNFKKHQRPHGKEPASTIPAAEKRGKTRKSAHKPDRNGEWGMGNGEQEREQEKEPAAASPLATAIETGSALMLPVEEPAPDEPKGFAEFWQAYPRKAARKAAVRAWVKLKSKPELRAAIVAGAKAWAAAFTPEELVYCPHPATWLNGERWKEDPPKRAGPSRASPPKKAVNNFDGIDALEELGRTGTVNAN